MALARRLRNESAIPIIILTGRREEPDRVMGLELARTTTSPSHSVRVSCWRESGLCCGGGGPRFSRGGRRGFVPIVSMAGSSTSTRDACATGPARSCGSATASSAFSSRCLVRPIASSRATSSSTCPRLHNDDVYNRSVNTQIMRLRRSSNPIRTRPRYIGTERGAGYFSAFRSKRSTRGVRRLRAMCARLRMHGSGSRLRSSIKLRFLTRGDLTYVAVRANALGGW